GGGGGGEMGRGVRARGVAVLRLLGEGFQGNGADGAGYVGGEVGRRERLDVTDLVDERGHLLSAERTGPGEQGVEHAAEREEVGSSVHRLAADLFGRGEGGRA